MQRTLLVYSSNRSSPHEFRDSLELAVELGCAVVAQRGTPDVALARNMALTMAAVKLRELPGRDVVLLVDDDIVWTANDARDVVNHARSTKQAAAGAYILNDGKVAAHYRGPRWNTGLGFVAVPREQLLGLAERCEPFEFGGQQWLEFTRSGVVTRNGQRHWATEDYFFTDRLGGVELLPIAVGHVKTRILKPSLEHLPAFIAKNEAAT